MHAQRDDLRFDVVGFISELASPDTAARAARDAGVAPERWVGFGTPQLAGLRTTLTTLAWMGAHPASWRFLRAHGLGFWLDWWRALSRGFHRSQEVEV